MLPGILGQVGGFWWVALVGAGPRLLNRVVQLVVAVLALRKAESKDVPAVVRALAKWGEVELSGRRRYEPEGPRKIGTGS